MSCKVFDPTIISVNPDGYWYRIASSPWSDGYYAPANTFLDGDPPNGPYTHNTDFAVPDCAKSSGNSTGPAVTLAKGPAAPFGFRYAVTVSGFATDASNRNQLPRQRRSRRVLQLQPANEWERIRIGPKPVLLGRRARPLRVVADSKYASNRVQWGSGTSSEPATGVRSALARVVQKPSICGSSHWVTPTPREMEPARTTTRATTLTTPTPGCT